MPNPVPRARFLCRSLLVGTSSLIAACASDAGPTPNTASEVLTATVAEAPAPRASERREDATDEEAVRPSDIPSGDLREVADLGQDATFCDLLDSRLTAQIALFDNGVSLLITTDDPALVGVVRRRASRFAAVVQKLADDDPGLIHSSVPPLERDEGREALVGIARDDVEVQPTSGRDTTIAVKVEAQRAPRGTMLVIVPADPTHVGDITSHIQRAMEEVEAGRCDGLRGLAPPPPPPASDIAPETSPVDDGE